MKKMMLVVAAVAACALGISQASAQNSLSNPGFESPLTNPPTPVGDWFNFGSGAAGFANQVSVMPRSGQMHMDLTVVGADQFAGVFQDLPGAVSPGQTVVFKGWHKSVGTDTATHEIKIEWKGAPQNRLDVFNVPNEYTQFMHMAVAPAGTTGARLTYAISNFGGNAGDATTYIDDMQGYVIPEPTSLGLAGAGLLALAALRRRK